MMVRRLIMVLMALGAADLSAMPTRAELQQVQPQVVDMMEVAVGEFRAASSPEKKGAAVKVGDAAMGLAKVAEAEAMKLMLLKVAVCFYAFGEEYGKAAQAIEMLRAEVKDVAPALLAELADKVPPVNARQAEKVWQERRNAAWLTLGEGDGKLEFVKCPPGSVEMPLDDNGHTVKVDITRPFWFLKDPLRRSQALAAGLIATDGKKPNMSIYAPYEKVHGFVRTLDSAYRAKLPKGYVIRLPTLAEACYAMRANTTDREDPYFQLTPRLVEKKRLLRKIRPNAWGISELGWIRILDRFDDSMFALTKTDSGWVAGGAKPPNASAPGNPRFEVKLVSPPTTVDPLYWTDNPKYYLWFKTDWMQFNAITISELYDKDIGPQTRLVVGPDLEGERKGKRGT